MSTTTSDPRLHTVRVAPRKKLTLSWSDPRIRNVVWQVAIFGGLGLIVWYFAANTHRNLTERHIATGFAFLGEAAAIPIGESVLNYIPSVSTYGTALLIGVLNTLKVAVVGVILATIWGTLVGIARLSKNWMLARLSAVYVETLRDIPLLLQLFFWYGLLQTLPGPRQALHPIYGVFLSNHGIKVPLIHWQPAHSVALVFFIAGLIGTAVWSRMATRKQEATGIRPKVWPVGVLLLIVVPLVVWAALGAPFQGDVPALHGFNFSGGGNVSPEYAALTFGLIVYTATYIAEIVRSGIQAVAQGQWEAAGALGLQPGRVLRLVILPQAMRVIIPPMTSQYLNLIKNSSLAIAVGYPDIVSIADSTLNQTGQAIEGIAIIMVVYLAFSLSISLFMNWYNKHIALVER
jgi:general L-amino acid transport system permease protein